MKDKLKKYITFYGIELLYCASIIWFIQFVTNSLSVSSIYEEQLVKLFILIILGITWVFGASLNKLINFILVGIYSLYLISQKIYYRGFGSYYRLRTAIGLKDEVVGAKDSAMELIEKGDFTPIVILLVITVVFYVLYFLIQRKQLKFKQRILLKLVGLLVIQPVRAGYQDYNDLILSTKNTEDLFQLYKTDYYVYDTVSNVALFVEKFGLVTLGYKDIHDLIVQTNDTNTYISEIEDYLDNKERVINTNDFTGLLKGKNILFVQAESFNEFGMDEDLTPTIYKLKHEGINISNFNTPALSGSTSDSEFMANTSIVPSSEGEPVCYKYVNNTYPVTLANLFKENGYTTIAIHNNYGNYYNRFNMFASLGYDDFYDCTSFGMMDERSDLEIGEKLKYIIADADYPLMLYWITYSGHQPYTLDSVGVSEEDVEKIRAKYPELDDRYVSFFAKNMDLDRALKEIMDQAEYTGTLDNLAIVFFGDHIVKGMEYQNCDDFFEQTGLENFYTFNDTDLFIYATDLEPAEYSKVSTLLDFLPTIANLYDYSYDEKCVLGRDIFDPSYNGFFFANYGELANDYYRYDMLTDSFYYTNGYDTEKAEQEIVGFERLLDISKKILKIDYYKTKETN